MWEKPDQLSMNSAKDVRMPSFDQAGVEARLGITCTLSSVFTGYWVDAESLHSLEFRPRLFRAEVNAERNLSVHR